jgi:HemY protein
VRVEALAAKAPGHVESALAVARAAIDASEFARAREALLPFIAAPTQRVAMLMAEIERTEHGDSGKARAWTLRAVRALHDPVWTADGYVSDRWRPVSPVTGRIDAFRWQVPVAALPSDKSAAIESAAMEEVFAPPTREIEPPRQVEAPTAAAQDQAPATPVAEQAFPPPPPASTPSSSDPAPAPTPLFRARADFPKPAEKAKPIPPVIPIVRAPDDPGVIEEAENNELGEGIVPAQGQAGGWRGFLSRWGG